VKSIKYPTQRIPYIIPVKNDIMPNILENFKIKISNIP
jgi:hypothetical protein